MYYLTQMFECEVCGNKYRLDRGSQLCECNEPLKLEDFFGEIKNDDWVMQRYREFLPFEVSEDYTLGEGGTPLTKAERISRSSSVDLFLKNETVNPTWSFKDRGTVIDLQRVVKIGYDLVSTVSTGNMAASVSAYCTHVGIDCVVLVPSDISDKKLDQISVYAPHIIKVDGDYGDLYYEVQKNEEIYSSISNSPFRIEGYKTISFEIAEEIEPDYVMIPTSSGGLFRGVMKGFTELKKSQLIDEVPTPISVQAEGCSPIYRAYKNGKKEIERWSAPETLAEAISNPYPPGGNSVLRLLKRFDGICEAVSDDEILSAQKDAAREGIFCQPSSAVGVAALKKLREKDEIERGSKVVAVITGSGLKTDKNPVNSTSMMARSLEDIGSTLTKIK